MTPPAVPATRTRRRPTETGHLVSPAQIRNVAFGKPQRGTRGYSEDEVDDFLDKVEATIRELQDRLAKYERR